MATVFAYEYREKRWVPLVAYGTAGLVALSRIGLGRHFPSDVFAGALIGHSMGRLVVHRSGESTGDSHWSHLQPLYDPETRGFGVAYRRSW